LGLESIFLKEPSEVTLTIESNFAIVLKVSSYEINVRFPPDVRKYLVKNSIKQLDLIKDRAVQIVQSEFPKLMQDINKTKLLIKT